MKDNEAYRSVLLAMKHFSENEAADIIVSYMQARERTAFYAGQKRILDALHKQGKITEADRDKYREELDIIAKSTDE